MNKVYAAAHPLRAERNYYEVAEGSSVADIIDQVDDKTGLRSHFVVHVGDRVVPREYWKYVTPKANTSISVRAVPMGGDDKDPLRTILTIVVVVAAAWVSGGGLGLQMTSAQAAVAGAVTSIVGRLLVDAIAPPPTDEEQGLDRDDRKPSIENARNRPQRFQPLPRIYGTYRFVPSYSVLPFTEVRDNDQYLHFAVCWGYGPLTIDDVRIGDTKIEEYDNVEISHNFGDGTVYNNGTKWNNGKLITQDIVEENLAVVLNEDDGYTVRTTPPGIDKISVDVTFPTGLVEITDEGNKLQRTVEVDVEYAPTGTTNWKSGSDSSSVSATQVSTYGPIHNPRTGGGGGVGSGGP